MWASSRRIGAHHGLQSPAPMPTVAGFSYKSLTLEHEAEQKMAAWWLSGLTKLKCWEMAVVPEANMWLVSVCVCDVCSLTRVSFFGELAHFLAVCDSRVVVNNRFRTHKAMPCSIGDLSRHFTPLNPDSLVAKLLVPRLLSSPHILSPFVHTPLTIVHRHHLGLLFPLAAVVTALLRADTLLSTHCSPSPPHSIDLSADRLSSDISAGGSIYFLSRLNVVALFCV